MRLLVTVLIHHVTSFSTLHDDRERRRMQYRARVAAGEALYCIVVDSLRVGVARHEASLRRFQRCCGLGFRIHRLRSKVGDIKVLSWDSMNCMDRA